MSACAGDTAQLVGELIDDVVTKGVPDCKMRTVNESLDFLSLFADGLWRQSHGECFQLLRPGTGAFRGDVRE